MPEHGIVVLRDLIAGARRVVVQTARNTAELLLTQHFLLRELERDLRLSKLRYDNGVASYLELLDDQRSLFTAQQSLVQTRLAQLQNQVLLYRALGGSWSRRRSAGMRTGTPE